MITATAPGKVILFGEHSVVYNKLGITSAINKRAKVRVSHGDDLVLEDYSKPSKEVLEPIKKVIQEVNGKSASIKISSEIPREAGLGSSSAVFTALTTSLLEYNNEELDNEEIERIARAGDGIAHGKPSGIDTRITTNGGFITFKKSEGFKPLKVKKRIPLIIVNTMINSSTKLMVEKVRKRIEDNMKYINEMNRIAEQAITAIKDNDLNLIGNLMNKNQKCLKNIGVSHPRINTVVEKALNKGALGAKLTGGGGGGCVIILAQDEENQKRINKEFKNSFTTKLGAEGVKIEH